MSYALEIENLDYAYPDGTRALHEINLRVEQKKKTALLGTNGSGKTTLLYHLNGAIPAQEGQVRVMGRPVTKENLRPVRKMVGLLFDSPDNQLFSTTVYGDVAFGPRNMGLSGEEVEKRVGEAICRVGIEGLAARPPYCLSLGQKKRAAIAGILAMDPEIMACDEPFSGLDPAVAGQFRDILDELKKQGRTLIYSTHDVDLAYGWADQVVVMKEGRILEAGSTELLQDESLMREASLRLPMLAELFKNSSYKPRTVEEASRLLSRESGADITGGRAAVDRV